MARPKKIKNPKKIPVTIEQDQYQQLIANGIINFSEWVRNRIDDYILVDNDLNQLKETLKIKEKEKEELLLDIETIKQKICEIETKQKENADNKEIQKQKLETIEAVIMNVFNGEGITKDRLIKINDNDLSSTQLKQLIKENNIKIISPSEIKTSHIIVAGEKTKKQKHNTPVKEVSSLKKLKLEFIQDLNRSNKNNVFSNISAKEYLGLNVNRYRAKCNNLGISFAEFQREVL